MQRIVSAEKPASKENRGRVEYLFALYEKMRAAGSAGKEKTETAEAVTSPFNRPVARTCGG